MVWRDRIGNQRTEFAELIESLDERLPLVGRDVRSAAGMVVSALSSTGFWSAN